MPVQIIAEAGVNHNGDLDLALKMAEAAKAVGADAVKYQTFHPEALASRYAGKAAYQKQTQQCCPGIKTDMRCARNACILCIIQRTISTPTQRIF